MRRFNQEALLARLARLPAKHRVAFAASVANRQLNGYEWYSLKACPQDQKVPRDAVDRVWEWAAGTGPIDGNWELVLDSATSLLPDVGIEWTLAHALANEALTSVAYAIRSVISPDQVREPVWAARHAYEAADQAAIRMRTSQVGNAAGELFALHPIVLRELDRQARDLEILEDAGEEAIRRVRNPARVEALLTTDELRDLDA